MAVLICTFIDDNIHDTQIFTPGKAYQANLINDGRLYQLFDNYGNAKVVSTSNTRFPLGEPNTFVHFKKFKRGETQNGKKHY